jgi:hypothetical protein
MATAKQCIDIFDEALGVASRFHAESLRGAGMLPSTQGRPEQLGADHVALLLLSVMIGQPVSTGHAELVTAYSAMRVGAAGPTLASILARYIDEPHDLFELKIELDAPGASLTFRRPDRGIATIVFYASRPTSGPALERYAIIDGNLLTKLVSAIKAAPEVKAGRRRRTKRFTN